MNLIRLRLLAVAIDLALLASAALSFKLGLLYLWPLISGDTSWLTVAITSFGYILLALLFYGCCAGVLRASPGKHILGLRLSAVDGDSITFFRAMLREALRLGEVLFFISGFFSLLNVLESRPTATDSLFRTYVRDKRR
jgi:uncharacterized RDD family membrane protein YckC